MYRLQKGIQRIQQENKKKQKLGAIHFTPGSRLGVEQAHQFYGSLLGSMGGIRQHSAVQYSCVVPPAEKHVAS